MAARTVFSHPDWPTIFELDRGDSYTLTRLVGGATVVRTIRVLGLQHVCEPDYWCEDNPEHRTLQCARVLVDVSGTQATLLARPYERPKEVNGLRLYVESTHRWAHEAGYARLRDVQGEVRLSAVAAGQGWGPSVFRFPIQGYRWRASSYNNTWLSLVPYNRLYYHRGDDFGAIPDQLAVRASLPGTLVDVPPLERAWKSNTVMIASPGGVRASYAHMNRNTIPRQLKKGCAVRLGQRLGKTGCTWNGQLCQHRDPHLHFGLHHGDTRLSPYPYLVEAYLRDYPESVLAVAGGYHFALPGITVHLDARRSVVRPGRRLRTMRWRLHTGRTVRRPEVDLVFRKPGLYSEELVVQADDGSESRDFAQVRVYDPTRGRRLVAGWAHYTPVRGIRPGTEVCFWNRLWGNTEAVRIDFGDGTGMERIVDKASHAYTRPGVYTVRLRTRGPGGEPACVGLPVVVEP